MKLFVLKLLSLLVFCLGVISLGVAMGVPQVQTYVVEPTRQFLETTREQLPDNLEFLEDALTIQGLWFGASIVAIVLGIYGFFPRFKKYRKSKKIQYEGPHGEVQIQLDSVEHSLNQVLARMPEIKKINVRVDPHDNARKAIIRADVVLNQQPGQNARAIASLVSDYIAETATKLLGLEEVATIDMNVTGIVVNSRRSSKAIRKESLSHSGNAPVELLEAAPAPLSLSGPGGQPLGSGPIEEELDEDAESEQAHDTSAIDTRKDETNQAAARSELLEPLSLRESRDRQAADAGGETEMDAERNEAVAEAIAEDEDPSWRGEPVAPRHMDVLDESLDDADREDEPDVGGVDFDEEERKLAAAATGTPDAEETSDYRAEEVALAEEEDAYAGEVIEVEDEEGESETEGEDGITAESGPLELTEDFSPEAVRGAVEDEDRTTNYPWDGGNAAVVETSLNTDEADGPESFRDESIAGTAEAADAEEREPAETQGDDSPGDVIIPEAGEEQPHPDETKKRWGGWFS